jgi:hypothetical protein
MTFKALTCGTAAALLAIAGSAGAATVTFDSLVNPGIWAYTGDTYTEQGMSFAATVRTNGYSLYAYGLENPNNADVDGATLHQEFEGHYGGLVVTPEGGHGSFTLTSLDLADTWLDPDLGRPPGGTVDFAYYDASGVHYQQLTLDDQPGLQTFTFNLTGVRSFTLWSNNYQLDNVQVSDVIAVPEPSSYALMLAGLAGVIGLSRRRKA